MAEADIRAAQFIPLARALNSVAKASGHPFTVQTQPGRFRIQKTVYLLKHLGYRPALGYSFNIYHMGPYSPELARAYYQMEDRGMRAAGVATDIPRTVLEVIKDALACEDPLLEGLTTLLDIRKESHDMRVALAQARAIKPHLSEPIWAEVRAFLKSHPMLTAAT